MLRLLLPALALVALLAPGAAALDVPLPQLDVSVEIDVPLPVDLDARVTTPSALHVPLDVELPADGTESAAASARASSVLAQRAEPIAASAAGSALLWLVLRLLGAPLYFRVQPDELLEHERRERVVDLVRERPGIGPRDLAQALGTGWGATMYHLDRLERAGLLTSQRVGHHRCYFLPGAVARDQQRHVGLFRGATARRVAELLLARPGVTQAELCATLGLSASAASKQLTRLEAAALVRRESAGAGVRVFPGPGLSGALAPAMA